MKQIKGTAGPDSGRTAHSALPEAWEYVAVLRRRWWIIALAGAVALGGAWWMEQGKVPTYTAEVLLERHREEPLIGMGGGGASADFAAQLEVIRTRGVMSAVVDSLGLQLRLRDREPERSRILGRVEVDEPAVPGSFSLSLGGNGMAVLRNSEGHTVASSHPDGWIEGPGFRFQLADASALNGEPLRLSVQDRQAAIQRLRGQVRVEPGRGANLIRISHTSPDPVMAAAVVNGVAVSYQEHRGRAGREAASRRRQAIAQQLAGLADSLEGAQSRVVDYQRNAQLMDPGQEGNHVMGIVLQTENELRTLRFQEGLLVSMTEGLEGGADAGDEVFNQVLSLGGGLVPAGPALHQRLQELQLERSRMTASRFGRTEGDPEVEVVDSLIRSTKNQMRSAVEQGLAHVRVQMEGAEERLAEMRTEMGAIPGTTAELAQLRQQADAVQGVVNSLVNRYYEAQITEEVEVGDVVVLDPAPVPLSPDRAQTQLVLMMGLLSGLMVGVLGAMGLEYLDVRVRKAGEAQAVTGLPLVGMIPKLRSPRTDPVAAAIGKESFRAVRTQLRFAQHGEPRVIAVSSATPREGKTTVAVNLAATLAEQEDSGNVLLVDADLRRPQVHNIFEMEPEPGLTEVLQGDVELEAALRTSPLRPNLHVLTSGAPASNPSELVGSGLFCELLQQLRSRYAFVVLDTPPLLAVTDGLVLAKEVDGTLVVVRANQADRVAVGTAMEQLRQVEATLLGVIFNGVDAGSGEGRYSYQHYGDYVSADVSNGNRKGRKDRKHLLLGTASGER